MKEFEKQGVPDLCDSDSDADDDGDGCGSEASEKTADEADDGAEDEDVFEELAEDLAAKGIFCVRCVAHSLQRLLHDFRDEIPVVKSACEGIEKLIEVYEKTPERAAAFITQQQTLGHAGKQIVRIGSTRWNTYIDAWKAILELRPIIEAVEAGQSPTVTKQTWDSFEKAIIICDPVGVAMDRVQADGANTVLLLQELYTIREKYEDLAKRKGMKTNAEKALGLFEKRVASNFSFKMLELFQFFNPLIDQRASYSDEKREQLAEESVHFAKCAHDRRQLSVKKKEEFNEDNFRTQMGRFLRRPDAEKEFPGIDDLKRRFNTFAKVHERYWSKKAVSWIELSDFAYPLGESCITEAAVERGISAEARIFSKLRSRMKEKSTESQTWLNMNHVKVTNPDKAARIAKRRQEKTVQKRQRQEKKIADLLAKRPKI
eukprot:gene13149-13900_t